MFDRQKILDKIKALQAKAKGTDNFEEAATFAEGVSRLLEQYNLTENDLNSHISSQEKIDQDKLSVSSGVDATWFRKLAMATATLYYSSVYVFEEYDTQKSKLTEQGFTYSTKKSYMFVGTKVNREIAASMFEYFVDTAYRMSRNYSNVVKNQNDFRKGFCMSLSFRIQEMINNRSYSVSENPDNLPVVINENSKAIMAFLENLGVFKFRRQMTVRGNPKHWDAGVSEANNVFLGQQVSNEEKLAIASDKRLAKLHGRSE